MNEKTIQYWVELSSYDLETAEAMLNTGRFLYVGFMCHQSIEKLLKAFYVKALQKVPPYIHNLLKLGEESGIAAAMTENQKEFLFKLEPLNIEARYPKNKNELFRELDAEKCRDLIVRTRELWLWINSKL